jgi:hypothetical protein
MRERFAKRFGLTDKQVQRVFGNFLLLDQIDRCADDAAQRLLLGISEKRILSETEDV